VGIGDTHVLSCDPGSIRWAGQVAPQIGIRHSQRRAAPLSRLGWQGRDDAVLHGIGDTAHSFDYFAPKFTNQFRVLGLTRRGHGESEVPDGGYDTATRVEDILQFLDALKISRVVLVGFSAAGGEVTMFAGKHPDRTIKAVYLDAVFDTVGLVTMRRRTPPELNPPKTTETKRIKALELMEMAETQTDYTVVGFPTNMINDIKTLPEERRKAAEEFLAEITAFKGKANERFREELPSARLVMLTNANHACFIDREDDVLREMRKFLSQ
jgi:pimeloyl-ACP methyl ester carboxylesterase